MCLRCSLGQPKYLPVVWAWGIIQPDSKEDRAACGSSQDPSTVTSQLDFFFPEGQDNFARWTSMLIWDSLAQSFPLCQAMAVTTAEGQPVPCLSGPFPVQPHISAQDSDCCLPTFSWLFNGGLVQARMLAKIWLISFVCCFFKQWLPMDFLPFLGEVQALLSQNTFIWARFHHFQGVSGDA